MVSVDGQTELWTPRYSYAEADHLADVSKGTSKRWLEGYQYYREGTRVDIPAVTPHATQASALSFIDLVEVAAIGRLKAFGFSLQKIRRIVADCRMRFDMERPLPMLKFKVGGRDAFVSDGDVLVAVGGRHRGERAWDTILGPFLNELDYEAGLARRWWPLGKSHVVVVDPAYGYGLPVVSGSGVRTEIILERVRAGDLTDEIARDFSLSKEQVDRALQFELTRAA